MHLRLTPDELLTLSEMAVLACETAALDQSQEHLSLQSRFQALRHRLLQSAQSHGLELPFTWDPDSDNLTFPPGPPSELQTLHDEARNALFWEELMTRLAERDLRRQLGESAWNALSDQERDTRLRPLEERYWQVFVTHGEQGLHWIEPQPAG